MQRPGRKCFVGFLVVALGYIALTGFARRIEDGSNKYENSDNKQWVASSKIWTDRQLCNWLGLCGTLHLKESGWTWDDAQFGIRPPLPDVSNYWTSGTEDPDSWSDEERERREIPQYVLDYAPYVHLYSKEEFWPCDLAEHLAHVSPRVNYTKIVDLKYESNLTNLYELNDYDGAYHGRYMYLQSDDNVEERPIWLGGSKNIPSTPKAMRDEDSDTSWPSHGDLEGPDADSMEQEVYAQLQHASGQDASGETSPVPTASTDGRCGGSSGMTCKGSKFGKCCSIYGWCGKGDAYCGDACDPMSGDCKNPYEPVPKPRSDLRKRSLQRRSEKHHPTPAGKSTAPAILMVVPKEDGIVDAFWFFFYSFNLGQTVFNIRFGNHVGDWEHTLIRFKHGKPETVFLSEHNFGDAYSWQALEKYLPNADGSGTMVGTWSNHTAAQLAQRPVVYSAEGSHAMYATPGLQPYILPWGMLHDITDRGPLWDPALNLKGYMWDTDTKVLRASTLNPEAPTGWFHYAGHWGDKFYPLSDPRQYRFAGQYHYVNGPTGPRFKRLDRKKVCQGRGQCRIRNWVGGARARRVPLAEGGEEGGLPGGNSTDGRRT